MLPIPLILIVEHVKHYLAREWNLHTSKPSTAHRSAFFTEMLYQFKTMHRFGFTLSITQPLPPTGCILLKENVYSTATIRVGID